MQKVKRSIKTALAGLLMAGAFAVPASAQTATNNCTAEQIAANLCVAVSTDNSDNYSVNGNCSAIQVSSGDISQGQSSTTTGVGGTGGAGVVGNGGSGGSGSASSSQSQTASQNQFSADCSQHVTNVTQAAASTSQVTKSPRGAVHAGAGGASESISTSSIIGLVGSVTAAGAGLVLRRQGFNL